MSTKAQVFHLVIITKTWCWLPTEESKSEPENKLDWERLKVLEKFYFKNAIVKDFYLIKCEEPVWTEQG